ncbi:glycosyltransferase family 1 protein, partial [Streptomyces sp. SID9944]|nr:glycosyltransferase family 1 protein [Streptomyces sp. SID9944]
AGRERVLAHFTWARAAEGTVARYREAIAAPAAPLRPVPPTTGRPAAAVTTAGDPSEHTESRATC